MSAVAIRANRSAQTGCGTSLFGRGERQAGVEEVQPGEQGVGSIGVPCSAAIITPVIAPAVILSCGSPRAAQPGGECIRDQLDGVDVLVIEAPPASGSVYSSR